jgi:hypothetical protein
MTSYGLNRPYPSILKGGRGPCPWLVALRCWLYVRPGNALAVERFICRSSVVRRTGERPLTALSRRPGCFSDRRVTDPKPAIQFFREPFSSCTSPSPHVEGFGFPEQEIIDHHLVLVAMSPDWRWQCEDDMEVRHEAAAPPAALTASEAPPRPDTSSNGGCGSCCRRSPQRRRQRYLRHVPGAGIQVQQGDVARRANSGRH